MSNNAVLCYLMGACEPLPPNVARSVCGDPTGNLLFALYCARADEVDGFADALGALDHDQLGLTSSYCLMLGLSGRVQGAFLLFDALTSRDREYPGVWRDLARLQAAWNYLIPAIRSATMYRKLSGRSATVPAMPRLQMTRDDPGPIHVLNGDLPSVRRL